jgi:hypothetical protein
MTFLALLAAAPRFDAEPAGQVMRRGARLLLLGLGLVILLAGLPLAFLPMHPGLPVMVIGLMLVLRNSISARRRFIRVQRRHPNVVFPLRRLMRRKPEIVPVFWQIILRFERLILRRWRFMGRLRRKLLKRARAATSAV